MSEEQYEEDCAGCRPACLDTETGEVLKPDHPLMQCINQVWKETTRQQREAFHRVMCLNSRAPEDLKACEEIVAQFQKAAKQKELN